MKLIKKYNQYVSEELDTKSKQDIIDDLGIWRPDQKFNVERFPVEVGEIKNKMDFSKPGKISVLDMVIKVPGGDIKIPFQDKSLDEIVEKILTHEKEVNPNWNNYYMYLTLHQSFVKGGLTQRRGGAHIDGMQGDMYPDKMPVCHSYIISDATPTIFHTNAFDLRGLDYKHNWFKKMQKQVEPTKDFVIKPYHIYFMTAYHVHSSVPALQDTFRTFIRIEFSLKKFNRLENTQNPLIKTNWELKDREIPKNLIESTKASDDIKVSKRQTMKKIESLEREGYFSQWEPSSEDWSKYLNSGAENLTLLSDYNKDSIHKKIIDIDKSNIFWFGETKYMVFLSCVIYSGMSSTEVRIIISEIYDEWFIVKFEFSHFTYLFKCDQLEGVLAFIESMYPIIKDFSIGRTVKNKK